MSSDPAPTTRPHAQAAAGPVTLAGVELPKDAPDAMPASRVGVIDGLRVLAMLWVFLYHAYQAADRPTYPIDMLFIQLRPFLLLQWSAGVDLFMVISGFCLFYPLIRKPGGLDGFKAGRFYLKRFWRLSPAYYAAILFVVLQPVVLVIAYRLLGREASWQPVPDLWQWVTHLTYTHSLFPSTWGGINPSFWAIGLFAQLYLVFPGVVWAVRRWGAATLVAMAAISLTYDLIAQRLFAGAAFETQMAVFTFFLAYWGEFAAGMGAAWIVVRLGNQRRLSGLAGNGLILGAFGLYLLWATVVEGPFAGTLRHTILALIFGMMIVGLAVSRSSLYRLFDNRAVALLAVVSFTVYLIHQPTIWYLSEFLHKELAMGQWATLWTLFTAGLALTLVISFVFYLVAERPFYRRSKRLAMTGDRPDPVRPDPPRTPTASRAGRGVSPAAPVPAGG